MRTREGYLKHREEVYAALGRPAPPLPQEGWVKVSDSIMQYGQQWICRKDWVLMPTGEQKWRYSLFRLHGTNPNEHMGCYDSFEEAKKAMQAK